MPTLKVLGVFFLLMTYSGMAWATNCEVLNTQEKMRNFVAKLREGNPMYRNNFSAQLKISPCEKANCSKKNRVKRKEKESLVHSLRMGEEKRSFFMKGNDHPICVVEKGIRKFKCSECGANFNDQCRSFNTASAIEGTNLDTIDMELLVDPNFELECELASKKNQYYEIEATKKSGDSPYDKIDVYFESEREILLQIRFYSQKILRKVYRMSPKHFTQVGDDWVATDIKVRTVQGSEKKYTFETRITMLKKGGEFVASPDPANDPYLDGTSMDVLFSTN